jgi:hypothetical protein
MLDLTADLSQKQPETDRAFTGFSIDFGVMFPEGMSSGHGSAAH